MATPHRYSWYTPPKRPAPAPAPAVGGGGGGTVVPPPKEKKEKDPWRWVAKKQTLDIARELLDATLPTFQHSIKVAVTGGPKSQIRRLWYLCLSAAFGRYRNRVALALCPLDFSAHWDITGKSVSVEILYHTNTISNSASLSTVLTGGPLNAPSTNIYAKLAYGPEQLTVGGSWPLFLTPFGAAGGGPMGTYVTPSGIPTGFSATAQCPLATTPVTTQISYTNVGTDRDTGYGVPGGGVAFNGPIANVLVEVGRGPGIITGPFPMVFFGSYPWLGSGPLFGPAFAPLDTGDRVTLTGLTTLPTLPDDGRVITTCEPNDPLTQPPRPIVDGQLRSSLMALVAQALGNPCFLPSSVPCTLTPTVSAGEYVYPPGSFFPTLSAEQVAIAVSFPIFQVTRQSANTGPDNYFVTPVVGFGGTPNTMPDYGSP